ncbi:origin recognition complex, subunit 4 [Neoconidiobolus thromboides FSU 785]|nr:origin recognition complex, subunit 4 [Neoconidiobolus thromboides FSU 785]
MVEDNKMYQENLKIIERLSGSRPPVQLVGLKEQHSMLKGLLSKSLTGNESNSLLMVGPCGCGKTTLLNKVINEIQTEVLEKFIKIELDGNFHQNARESIIGMAKQLKSNYQIEERMEDGLEETVSDAFSLNKALEYILQELGNKSKKEKNRKKEEKENKSSLLIVLENMDLFALHPKQTLLYNLFDLVQRDTPVNLVIIGITNKIEIHDHLEKRVKSRFSHRQIYVDPPQKIQDYLEILKNALLIENEIKDREFTKHNEQVEELLKDKKMLSLCREFLEIHQSVTDFLNFSHMALYLNDFSLKAESFEKAIQIQGMKKDHEIIQIQGLPWLELALLIAVQKLIIEGKTVFNFELIYKKYGDNCAKRIGIAGMNEKAESKEKAEQALQRLIKEELLVFADKQTKRVRNFQVLKSTVSAKQIKDAIIAITKPTDFLHHCAKY